MSVTPKIYDKYLIRKYSALRLWDRKRREERNNWQELLQLPYPRFDPIERRVKRFGLDAWFDVSTVTYDAADATTGQVNEYNGFIDFKASVKTQYNSNT